MKETKLRMFCLFIHCGCFIFSLQINLTLTLPLWGGSTPGTAVEGVVDKDVAFHAKELCTLRARIYLQENKRNTRIKMI